MVPETAVADFVKAGGEDVLEKSAHELWSGETASSRLFPIAWLDIKGDALIVEGNDPAVGEGGSEDVACEIIEDGLLAIPPWGAMNDPGLGPNGFRHGVGKAGLGQAGTQLAAHHEVSAVVHEIDYQRDLMCVLDATLMEQPCQHKLGDWALPLKSAHFA